MGTFVALFVLAGLLAASSVEGSSEPWLKKDMDAERGSAVELPCVIKLSECGGLHSIKWYRGAKRIFIFSEKSGPRADDVATRLSMDYETNKTQSLLRILDLKLEDEGLYKCEATYLAVNRECNNVQHITLTVTVTPDKLVVTNEATGGIIANGSTLTPVNEGTRLVLNCESGEGKPVPEINWFNGTQLMKADNSSSTDSSGVGIGKSRLEVVVTRGDLGADFTCEAKHLKEKLKVKTNVVVNVKPLGMSLRGVDGHVRKGEKVTLQCEIKGARPAANVTWYNGTDPITNEIGIGIIEPAPVEGPQPYELKTSVIQRVDGTYETDSSLMFYATQYENGVTFSCDAENTVTRQESGKPMRERVTTEVWYPPIVTVKPENITVNQSQKIRLHCEYISNPAALDKVKWLRNGEEVDMNDVRIEGGIPEQTTLVITNSTPSDMGTYTCVLRNSVGESTSSNSIEVSVLYTPVVEVSMEPQTPVNETDRLNVSLTCGVQSGNPSVLSAVRWYLDGDLLKELPDCVSNSTLATIDESSTFCDIDPSKLLLEVVGRSFHGNYSCEGRNEAGWGSISPSTPVIVYYKPGPASISYEPQQVVKKGRLKLTCTVSDMGRPEATAYKWMRGQVRLSDANESVWIIDPANLETQANFTCLAYNEAGDGESATTFVEVFAPPAFIRKLPPYNGTVYNTTNASIVCQVECVPLCTISWMRDDTRMDFKNNKYYYLSNTVHPPHPATNDFQSISSELIWNMTSWPNGQLDREADKARFTCESSSNGIGPGVKSTTHFHVEYPPENVVTSNKTVNVTAEQIPGPITCSAKAHPEPSFKWYRQGSAIAITETYTLSFDVPIPRRSTGYYVCEAKNRHGSETATTFINVQFKPTCSIEKERINGDDYLVCSADANPSGVDFEWGLNNPDDTLDEIGENHDDGKSYILIKPSVTSNRTYVCVANNSIGSSIPCEFNTAVKPTCSIEKERIKGDDYLVCSADANPSGVDFEWDLKNQNDTLDQIGKERENGKSYILIDPSVSSYRTYVCVANNSIGSSSPCEFNIAGNQPWWMKLEGDLLLIIIIIVVVGILAIIIICIVLFLICRRKRNQAKHNNRVVEMEERDHPDGGPPSLAIAAIPHPTPAPRWPLKPGVLVHVNRSHSLRSGLSTRLDLQSRMSGARGASSCLRNDPERRSVLHETIHVARTPVRAYRRTKDTRRVMSMSNVHEDGMLARANRIRAMFGSQFKDSDTFPGISRDKTAVTYKRIVPRQRVSCNAVPFLQAATTGSNYDTSVSRKRKKPGADPTQAANNNHVDSVSEGVQEPETKTFYENLPFHGIQTPPSKLISPKFARVSALHGTLHSATSSPASSRPASRPASRTASLCGGSSGYGSTRSHLGPHYSPNNMPRSNSPELKYNSLKPRRRKHKHAQFYSLRLCRRHQNTHHNYQLYAVPIRKNCPHKNVDDSAITEDMNKSTCESIDEQLSISPPIPAPRTRRVTDPSQHTYQNVPPPVFPQNIPSCGNKNIKTANLYNYQEHYQQHQQELQQYGYPVASGSSNQLTLPLTRSLHHSSVVSPSPMQTTNTNSSSNAVHLNHRHSLPRALIHGDMEMDLVHDHQQRQSGGSGGRRHERRKHRKHANDRKQKQQRRQDPRRTEPPFTFSRETSFNQILQEPRGGGVRENTYKISYPHYYEDSITECPLDYPSYEGVPREQREQREREVVDRYSNSNSSLRYADPHHANSSGRGRSRNNKTNNKTNKTKRDASSSLDSQSRSPSVPPPATQYPELHFRDVGQEIDV